jgi:AraC-like DNA-binding protein
MKGNGLGPQTYFPKVIPHASVATLNSNAAASLEGSVACSGGTWTKYQMSRDETFALIAFESYGQDVDRTLYTRLDRYVKINFWLSGVHTTVLDGFGECSHDRPEVFITAGPQSMLKIDMLKHRTHIACVALCVLPEFFSSHLTVSSEDLPAPLSTSYAGECLFFRDRLTPELATAARAILTAPFKVRRQPVYAQAKAVELMCLLINHLESSTGESDPRSEQFDRQTRRIYQARDLIDECFATPLTLERVSKQVGLNRLGLTSGFRRLFGLSVHDYLQKVRMDHALELLQRESVSVTSVAHAVGYSHSCNFSTAFHAYFGCSPGQAQQRNLISRRKHTAFAKRKPR